MIFHVSLSLALMGSLALAAMLWRWADRVAGARPLTWFLTGVAVWIMGNELPTWFGPQAERAGLMLLATAALTAAVFLHFTVAFTRTRAGRLVAAGYAAGIPAMLVNSPASVPNATLPCSLRPASCLAKVTSGCDAAVSRPG